MRSAVVALAALIALAAPAAGEVGRVGVFSDAVGGDCNLLDVAGYVDAEIVMVGSDGCVQVSFAVEEDPGVAMSVVREDLRYTLTLGTLHGGIRFVFGACETSPIRLATITYAGTGTTAGCAPIRIVAHPGLGTIEAWDCQPVAYTSQAGGVALVSSEGDCGCDVAAEASTWGRIKALYR